MAQGHLVFVEFLSYLFIFRARSAQNPPRRDSSPRCALALCARIKKSFYYTIKRPFRKALIIAIPQTSDPILLKISRETYSLGLPYLRRESCRSEEHTS